MEHAARGTKERITKKRPADMSPFVVAHRGDDPVALITIRQHDRDLILKIAAWAAAGFDADNIGIAYESYQSTPKAPLVNPLTGQPWTGAWMAEAVEHQDAITRGWITENVSLCVANRAGDFGMRQLPFKYVGGKHLHWLESAAWTALSRQQAISGGVIPETMTAFMSAPSNSQRVPADFPLDRNERDYCTAQLISRDQHAVLMYSTADDRERLRHFGTGWRPV